MATVHALTSYPIKGCAGVVVARTEITPTGLPHDRLFAVVGPDGATIWQGEPARESRTAADPTALLVLSLSSLDDLNARIVERGADPVPMTRFRPNIVI